MKSFRLGLAALAAFACGSISYGEDFSSLETDRQIAEINSLTGRGGQKWVAGETSVSRLTGEDLQARVGFNFQPLNVPLMAEAELEVRAAVPAELDWRNNGGNFVPGVRDQKKCGSCWAFAMTGGLEGYVMRGQNTGKDVDLSEQIMVSCSGVGSCNGGTLNSNYLKSDGLPPEEYYVYTATDGNCSSAKPGWQNATYKIGSWGGVSTNVNSIKSALNKYGPLPTAMYVYEDFKHYKSGVYSYTTGKKLGGHAVLLVGYSDAEQCFIVKNSWGTGWGDTGFFKIAYSELTEGRFGISTVAYKTGGSKKELPFYQRQAESSRFDLNQAWRRVEPILPLR